MKDYIQSTLRKVKIGNLLIGVALGMAIGASVVNHYAPTSNEMLELCKMDKRTMEQIIEN